MPIGPTHDSHNFSSDPKTGTGDVSKRSLQHIIFHVFEGAAMGERLLCHDHYFPLAILTTFSNYNLSTTKNKFICVWQMCGRRAVGERLQNRHSSSFHLDFGSRVFCLRHAPVIFGFWRDGISCLSFLWWRETCLMGSRGRERPVNSTQASQAHHGGARNLLAMQTDIEISSNRRQPPRAHVT